MYEAKKFTTIREMEGFSEKMMTDHYKLYEGYVKKANEILEKLKTVDSSTANATYSELRELKLEFAFAVGGVKNHEIYFEHLGGKGGKPDGLMEELIAKNFGSFETWATDVKQTGLAARGWVWTAFDWDTKTLFNYLGDSQSTFPIWNATPLVALDVYEHAYLTDYGINRGAYIDAFFKALDWNVVEERVKHFGIDKALKS
jgi:Fe-Mn family superoxide dismutase